MDSEVRGSRTGVQSRGLSCTTGRKAQSEPVRGRRRNRRSVGTVTVDSEERGPTAGVAGSGLWPWAQPTY